MCKDKKDCGCGCSVNESRSPHDTPVEKFVKKLGIGPNLLVKFENDPIEYVVKNLSANPERVFVYNPNDRIDPNRIYNKDVKKIVMSNRKPVDFKTLSENNLEVNKQFDDYVKEVQNNIEKEYPSLLKQAKSLESAFPGVKVEKVSLSGSYSKSSNKKPAEDSDIDIAVYFSGGEEYELENIAEYLAPLHGEFGLYDVHPIRTTSLPEIYLTDIKLISKEEAFPHQYNEAVNKYVGLLEKLTGKKVVLK